MGLSDREAWLQEGLAVTPRQRQLLYLVSVGHRDAEVASLVGVSLDTVKTHLARTYRRLGARNRAHAVRRAFETGVLGTPGEDALVPVDLADVTEEVTPAP